MTLSELLARCGEAVYGRDAWRSRIATDMNVSPSHVFSLLKGRRSWTEPMQQKLMRYAREHKVWLKADYIRAENALDELRDELERRSK